MYKAHIKTNTSLSDKPALYCGGEKTKYIYSSTVLTWVHFSDTQVIYLSNYPLFFILPLQVRVCFCVDVTVEWREEEKKRGGMWEGGEVR